MNKYEKELEELSSNYKENYGSYCENLEKINTEIENLYREYSELVGTINSERHFIRDEIRSLFAFLEKLGDVGIPVTVFDYVSEIPEVNKEFKKHDPNKIYEEEKSGNALKKFVKFAVFPPALLKERSDDKKDLVSKTKDVEEDYSEWKKQLDDARSFLKFRKTALEIADLYRAIVATVRDTIKYTIIPELDVVAAFLSAYSIKDAILYGENPDEATQNRIEEFIGTPYETHYIFVKNTFEYYQMIKTFFTTPILTNITDDYKITKKEERDFKQQATEIEEKGKLLKSMTSFGG